MKLVSLFALIVLAASPAGSEIKAGIKTFERLFALRRDSELVNTRGLATKGSRVCPIKIAALLIGLVS